MRPQPIMTSLVDASETGSGNLEIMVNGGKVPCTVDNRGRKKFIASFLPENNEMHTVEMKFNNVPIAGSPWYIDVTDNLKKSEKLLPRMKLHTPTSLHQTPANKNVSFFIETDGLPTQDIDVVITAPSGREVACNLYGEKNGYRVEYTPNEVGTYKVNVFFAGSPIPQSPFTMKSYDSTSINVSKVPDGIVGQQVEFFIDVTKAGEGQLEIMINDGNLPNTISQQKPGVYKVSFTPQQAVDHFVDIVFNGERLPGSPYTCHVSSPTPTAPDINVELHRRIPNQQSTYFVIPSHDIFSSANNSSSFVCTVEIRAPSGNLIPNELIPQPDGDYRVQWMPVMPGRYTINVLYAGHQIQGSPFYVDVFDISSICISDIHSNVNGNTAYFDIVCGDVESEDFDLEIKGPNSMSMPYNFDQNNGAIRVTFNPSHPGEYKIYVRYRGVDLPDTPLVLDVENAGLPTTFGDGLTKGEKDKLVTFAVDARNLTGELAVHVEGPNSIAKCTIEEKMTDTFEVSYIPVEVGVYNVTVKWNDYELLGSPFHPNIVDPRKVNPVGSWQHYLDSNGNIHLNTNEEKRITFDVSSAGPGKLTAKVIGQSGVLLPVRIEESSDNKSTVVFSSKEEGVYFVHIHWSGHPILDSPFIAHAKSSTNKTSLDQQKIKLFGQGLKEARTHEKAEFIIDGTDAGPGRPHVRLESVKHSLNVQITHIEGNKYRCEYTPDAAGAYLLYITWNGCSLKGSPFKVEVQHSKISHQIQVTGEGLRGGMMGKDISLMIDARHAAPGELTAHCMGPNLVANCSLTDMHDGTFRLSIQPQESGKHTLHIQYAGEHVFGSPYIVNIYSQTDPSKVRVYGPGVKDGILSNFKSHFIVETKGAGAGGLTIRIRGPKGAYQAEMIRKRFKDRTITCLYEPTETGLYTINVLWSGVEVPGSPFVIHLCDSHEELEKRRNTNLEF